MSSIFTKIINGEIPSLKIFEDEWTYSFLDIRPIQLGHSLIVPKTEVDSFLDVDAKEYERVFLNAKKISTAIQNATHCKRVGLVVAGYEVPHFHVHMIPTWDMSDFDFNSATEVDPVDLKNIHERILKNL